MNDLLNTFFFSGSSSITDLRAVLDGGGNVGLVANRLSGNGLRRLSGQSKVFVDSGAFGEDVGDFHAVFDVYREVVDRVGAPNAFLVMPDVYRDQLGSLAVIEQYADEVRDFIDGGCEAIIPLQSGELDLSDLYERVVAILGTDGFRVGLPMASQARHPQECIHAFLMRTQPAKVHFLGRSFRPLRKELEFYKAFCDFDASSDAAMITNWVSEGKSVGDNIQFKHKEAYKLTYEEVDPTERCVDIYWHPELLRKIEIEVIALVFGIDKSEVYEAMAGEKLEAGHWDEFIERKSWGYALIHELDWEITKVQEPKSPIRYREVKAKVQAYLTGAIFERATHVPQQELLFCA